MPLILRYSVPNEMFKTFHTLPEGLYVHCLFISSYLVCNFASCSNESVEFIIVVVFLLFCCCFLLGGWEGGGGSGRV